MNRTFKGLVSIMAVVALVGALCSTAVACDKTPEEGAVAIQYVSEAPQAKQALLNGTVDFALVGEPAATAFGTEAGGGFSARLNMQSAYAAVSGQTTYPQAGIFVKESVAKDAAFMAALFEALASSKEWVLANPANVTAQLKASYDSASTFPAPSIARCALKATALSDADKTEINTFLAAVMPSTDFVNVNLCDVTGTNTLSAATALRFAVPDGTPALTIARMEADHSTINGVPVNYEVISAATIATEIGGSKADIIIAPVNAGANLIAKGAAYRMVSIAVEGSLYIVGSPDKVNGATEITLDDLKGKTVACIGKGGTPDLVFQYVVSKTEGIKISE